MSEQTFTAEDIATTVTETLNMFSTVAVDHALALIPNPETPGNPAIVITARDGSRYGLEVCPIPEPHVLPDTPQEGPMAETKQQHWLRRGRELNSIRKAELCAMYRELGGLGGTHPPEKWRKDEVISSIVDIEWNLLAKDTQQGESTRSDVRTKPNSAHYEGCSADEDPDGETMCVCSSIEAEPKPDPREDEGCQAEFIDGTWYGDDCPDCRQSVQSESDECEQCQEEDYCSKHANGAYG